MVARFADYNLRFKGDGGGGEILVGGRRPTMMGDEEMKAERDDEMGEKWVLLVMVASDGGR